MTFNIENGGTQVDFNKVVEAIKQSGADAVGIQEAWGNTERLAKALHWYYNTHQHIISRFPIIEAADTHFVYLELLPHRYVVMANIHLPDEPYGPDLIAKGVHAQGVEANERRVRLSFILPYILPLKSQTLPVFLTGDFNSPSHLDWTANTVHVLKNHPYKVTWPVTQTLALNGFSDSFRLMHPDPIQTPGDTWPAKRPLVKNSIDDFNPSENDGPHRIDFIFANRYAEVIQSKIIGETVIQPWPSDHRAVLSRFKVYPQWLAIKPTQTYLTSAKPAVYVEKKIVKQGEPIHIAWKNAPGNRYDYIRISPHGTTKIAWGEAVRVYTYAKPAGKLTYDEKSAQGNWLTWHTGKEGHWPLAPGIYDIKLMLDDSFTELVSTKLVVKD